MKLQVPSSRKWLVWVALLVSTALAVAVWFDIRSYPSKTQPDTTTGGSTDSQPAEPAAPSEPKTYQVKVFFSKKPESDNDPGKVFAVQRTSPDLGVGKFAITELLKGPSATEKDQGYFTAAKLLPGESICAGQDFKLAIDGGVATLQFCRRFEHLGVVADGQADSAIKATLGQFATVKKVVILNREGNCEFDLSGMNLCKQ